MVFAVLGVRRCRTGRHNVLRDQPLTPGGSRNANLATERSKACSQSAGPLNVRNMSTRRRVCRLDFKLTQFEPMRNVRRDLASTAHPIHAARLTHRAQQEPDTRPRCATRLRYRSQRRARRPLRRQVRRRPGTAVRRIRPPTPIRRVIALGAIHLLPHRRGGLEHVRSAIRFR
jgi:hypothetical protein